ncbi:galactose-6-phosphate isomerase subunit LacA [Aerococcaceae bacterium DSM 111020]|nr:galactose-6-phosphate isomerase subunit LacA [Aerococcaceae bacterium DSM 111020]
MKVILGADKDGKELKEIVKSYLEELEYQVVDVTSETDEDFINTTLSVAEQVNAEDGNLGIVIDGYSAGSFMVATKVTGMVAAAVSDERSAYMTREHNNSRMITMGAKIVGPELAKKIAAEFLAADYDGGRHQIRVDMLNKMMC